METKYIIIIICLIIGGIVGGYFANGYIDTQKQELQIEAYQLGVNNTLIQVTNNIDNICTQWMEEKNES